jgi:hypothetical protein
MVPAGTNSRSAITTARATSASQARVSRFTMAFSLTIGSWTNGKLKIFKKTVS